jgi:hypothetical protein
MNLLVAGQLHLYVAYNVRGHPVHVLAGLISIAAAVVGGVSTKRIAVSGGRLKGNAMADFGFVVGAATSAYFVLVTLMGRYVYHVRPLLLIGGLSMGAYGLRAYLRARARQRQPPDAPGG